MAEGKKDETLVAFESGHYKTVKGKWKGDSVWCHFNKADGGMVHINKDKVEYMESFGDEEIKVPKSLIEKDCEIRDMERTVGVGEPSRTERPQPVIGKKK
jgi:hypothetical protein